MQWEKKICIRITVRRIIIAILIAASSVDLIIVGAAFEAAPNAIIPTTTLDVPAQILTMTFIVPTATTGSTLMPIASQAETLTLTNSPTYTITSTDTLIPSSTSTSSPVPTQCALKTYWYVYYVQSGDTLYALARSTDSTIDELMLANCLSNTRIFKGQVLYVPRLPIKTPTPSPAQVDTPTIVPTNPPTVFQNPLGDISLCYSPYQIYLSVLPFDSEGVSSVNAFYNINNGAWNEISMGPDGATYYGSETISSQYSQIDMAYYYFSAVDSFGNITYSDVYNVTLISSCPIG